MAFQIQLRRDTLANWTAANPILAQGELSYVTDGAPAEKIKIGDGSTAWLSLGYFEANQVSDVAYDATSWNGVTNISPSKNSVRDEIETLITSISGKAPTSHSHALSDITQSGATTSQIPQWSGTAWVPVSIPSSESTTVSNVGAGSGVFKQLTGSDIELRKINAGAGITVTQNASDITVDSTITQYTDTLARAAVVIDSIADSDVDHAPSRNAVFDALAGKQPLDTQLTDLAGLSYTGNSLKAVRVNTGETAFELYTPSVGVTDHTALSNIGTNTHAQIDTHIADTSNPHSVTKAQVGLSNADNTSDINKPISTATQNALDLKVDENASITGATKTKITYDAKGLVTAGADATTADISDSTNKRYVTDAQLAAIGTTSFPLLAPNGSVTAPSYAFSETSNDTGLYHTGDGNISVAVNGVRKASFDSTSITFDVDINVSGKQYVYQSIADLLNEDPAIKIDKAVSNTANVTGQYAAGLGSAVLVSDAFNHTNSFYLGAVGEVRYQSVEGASAICGGVQGSVDYNSTGTLFAGIGLSANVVNNNATGVITTAAGVVSEIANDGGGGITTGYNFRVDANAATNAWGFYCDQDIKHFLGGETRFGGTNDASPPAKIDTSGNATFNSIKIGSGSVISYVDSGTYTPTLTNVTNVSASTAYKCQWLRVGNTVTVSGKIDVDSTSPGALEVGISLPVASNFANEEDCAGTGVEVTGSPDAAWIKADATNNRASLNQNNNDTSNHSHFFTFTYEVI